MPKDEAPVIPTNTPNSSNLNPKYTFNSFVIYWNTVIQLYYITKYKKMSMALQFSIDIYNLK